MRRYEETHPWITFDATAVNDLDPRLWMLIGEARSKCEHLAGSPLQPQIAKDFGRLQFIKGVHATTSIEGNTLTEEQIDGIMEGTYTAPESRTYQEAEVLGVMEIINEIDAQVALPGETPPTITVDLIYDYNRRVLQGTNYADEVVPGQARTYGVEVGRYRGAPAEDCQYLLGRLVEWLEGETFRSDDPVIQFALSVAAAVYAHLYIAWIHPFGDGNGRTARLLEFLILARCGMIPLPAAHLLSNHYNLTRDQYVRELGEASKTKDTKSILGYAVQGFVDGLREQISTVQDQQLRVTWINYVHEILNEHPNTDATDRRRLLALALPFHRSEPIAEIRGLTSKLAELYAGKGSRTLARDLNELQKAGLIWKTKKVVRPRVETVEAFRPPMADPLDLANGEGP